jgi:hypothetical protein
MQRPPLSSSRPRNERWLDKRLLPLCRIWSYTYSGATGDRAEYVHAEGPQQDSNQHARGTKAWSPISQQSCTTKNLGSQSWTWWILMPSCSRLHPWRAACSGREPESPWLAGTCRNAPFRASEPWRPAWLELHVNSSTRLLSSLNKDRLAEFLHWA